MSCVYVPQIPAKYDRDSKLWIPTVNLSPARRFGQIVEMLPAGANRVGIAPMVQALKEKMDGYTADDYLVALGDPSLIAAAACIASRQTGGLLRLLKWDRLASDYVLTELKI